jgi:hypothetical protein
LTLAVVACGNGTGGTADVSTDLPLQDIAGDTDIQDNGTDESPEPDSTREDSVSDDGGAAECDPRIPAAGEVQARRIVCMDEAVPGPESLGTIGDFLLRNDRVRFVIRAGTAHAFVGLDGGNLVDADLVRSGGEPGQERFRELQPLFGFNAIEVDEVVVADPGTGGEAMVRVSGTPIAMPLLDSLLPGFPVMDATILHEYVLAADSNVLLIRTRVVLADGSPAIEVAPIEGYFVSGELQAHSPDPLPLLVHGGKAVSYGYLGSGGFAIRQIGDVPLGMADPVPVPAGGEISIERWLIVGDGSVSSVTDGALALAGVATGAVSGCVTAGGAAAGAGVEVRASTGKGRLLTYFRTGDDGCFGGFLPLGEATLVATCAGCNDGEPVRIDVDSDGIDGLALTGNLPSFLEIVVKDGDGQPVPARITLVPADDPDVQATYLLAWPPERRFPTPPGRWIATASRGFEYGRDDREVEVVEGEVASLELTLEHEVPTPGVITAEFHVHSQNSVDSGVALGDRVLSFACEGVEFAVSSDHDFVTDYGPVVEALGLGSFLTTVPGVEISSVQAGHFNAWPMVPDPSMSGNGAPAWFGLPPGELVRVARDGIPGRVVQVNHPRFQDGATFDLIGFDPADGKAHADPASLGFPEDTDLNDFSFDAIEVFNAIGHRDLAEQMQDWYALLWSGRRITATAGGDSHDLKAFPGHPRNLVMVDVDDPADLDVDAVNEAVKAMRVLVTTGPYLEAGLVDPVTGMPVLPGETVSDTDGEVEVHLRVRAPSWMEVTSLTVVVGGEDGMTIQLEPGGVDRLDTRVTIPATTDTWVVAIARGPRAEPHLSRYVPFALTNPTFLDADGNGSFDPRQ